MHGHPMEPKEEVKYILCQKDKFDKNYGKKHILECLEHKESLDIHRSNLLLTLLQFLQGKISETCSIICRKSVMSKE